MEFLILAFRDEDNISNSQMGNFFAFLEIWGSPLAKSKCGKQLVVEISI